MRPAKSRSQDAGSNLKHCLMLQTLRLARHRECSAQTIIEMQLEKLCNIKETLTSR